MAFGAQFVVAAFALHDNTMGAFSKARQATWPQSNQAHDKSELSRLDLHDCWAEQCAKNTSKGSQPWAAAKHVYKY